MLAYAPYIGGMEELVCYCRLDELQTVDWKGHIVELTERQKEGHARHDVKMGILKPPIPRTISDISNLATCTPNGRASQAANTESSAPQSLP